MTIMWRWATGKLTTTHNSVPVEIFRFLRTSFLRAWWMRWAYRAGVSFFSRTKFQPCILRKYISQSHESRARELSMSDRFLQISLAALAPSSLNTEHHSYKVNINSDGTQVPNRATTLSHQRQGYELRAELFALNRVIKIGAREHLIAKRCG